jgi:hypothetical protein
MDDHVRPHLCDQGEHSRPIPDIHLVMLVTVDGTREPRLVPAGISGRPEEHRALIVIDPVDLEPGLVEIQRHFGADQSGSSGYQASLHLLI